MKTLTILGLSATILLSGCAKTEMTKQATQTPDMTNPLLQKWTGPYGGVPAFDKMQIADIKPAFEYGMQQNLAEIEAIANNPQPATFENTIVELEKSGELLNRLGTYIGRWSSNISSDEFRSIQRELAPKYSELSSKINQNKKLFQRVKTVYEKN